MNDPSLTVWTVDLARVRGVLGSRNPGWLANLERADDPQPLRDAARSLVMRGGPPFVGDPRSLCIVLGDIVTQLGARLPDNIGHGIDLSLLERGDALLERAGVGIAVSQLVFAGPAIPDFPEAEALPMLGFLTVDEVARAHAALSTRRLTDPDVALDELLKELTDWVTVAAARGESLVGIYA